VWANKIRVHVQIGRYRPPGVEDVLNNVGRRNTHVVEEILPCVGLLKQT
jgi:hypothetical protein